MRCGFLSEALLPENLGAYDALEIWREYHGSLLALAIFLPQQYISRNKGICTRCVLQHFYSSTSSIRCCCCSCIDYALLYLRSHPDISLWVLLFSFPTISYFSLLTFFIFHLISRHFYSFSHNICTRSTYCRVFTGVLEHGQSRIWKYPFQHFKQYNVENKQNKSFLQMLESSIKTVGVQTQQLKANMKNKGSLLIPAH